MKKICIVVFCFCCYQSLYCQLNMKEQLVNELKGKTKFYDIKSTVENFYIERAPQLRTADAAVVKEIDRQRKKWNRYFYESETHLNPEGKVENAAQRTFDFFNTNSAGKNLRIAASIGGSWSLVGPTNSKGGTGRINRMAFDHSNAQILYAGAAGGGLFKSTNSGVSWTNVASYIPSLGISGIVVSHNNPNTIYVLTGDGDGFNSGGFTYSYGYIRYSVGILKSTDGGQSFQQTGNLEGSTGTNYVGFNLVQDPNNANILIAATNRGAYRTTDGGITWTQCNFGGIGTQRRVYDVEYKPGSSTTVYCTARDNSNDCRFFKSTDGGATFSLVNIDFMDDASRIEIAVTPANASYVYLLAGPGYITENNASNNTFRGLFRSTDSGGSFTKRSSSPDILGYDGSLVLAHQSDYDIALAVSPTNSNTVIAGGLVTWRSNDGGSTWTQTADYSEDGDNSNYIHPDVHHLIFNPANNALYASTDGGVSVNTGNADNWANLFNGLSCTQFYHFEASNEDAETWGGTQDNGTQIRTGVSSIFTEFDGGDGYDVLTDKAPAGNNDDKYWVVNKEIWEDGVTNINITPPGINEYFPNLAMCPTNEDILFAGYSKLFISYDRGSDWSDFYSGAASNYYVPGNWSLSTCPTNSQRIYAAGINNRAVGLYRVDNMLTLPAVPTRLTQNLEAEGYPTSHPKITDIAVSQNGSNVLWVTVSGYHDGQKVYRSTNAGNSWTNISDGLPNLPVHTIVADANDNIYIGTDIGVYYRGNGQAEWTPFYNLLPRVAVSELEIAFDLVQNELRLFASTFGRGIWVSDIFGNCPSSLTLTATLQGQRFYQASNNINATSPVTGAAGTNVYFRSGEEVNLTSGFNAVPGTEFVAYIAPCNSGVPGFRTAFSEIDSLVSFQNKINEFRLYGHIEKIDCSNTNTAITVNLKQAGDYFVKIYNAATNKYLTTERIKCLSPGIYTSSVFLADKSITFLRADLFKDADLVYVQDFENK